MNTMHPTRRRQRGFTIMEAIVVIIITGILATFITVFIQIPVRAYLSTSARAEATDLADNTMRRLTRDLRLALPNSVRVDGTGRYIEYIETRGGLRYLAEDDVDTPGGGQALSWTDTSQLIFTVVGGVPTGRLAPIPNADSMVVYNLGKGQEPANAYDCSVPCNRTAITAMTTTTLKMASNVFAAQSLVAGGSVLKSPGKRFHVVSGPVTYGCDLATKRLTRYANYAYSATQAAPPSGAGMTQAILADNVSSCAFSYTNSQSSQRSAMVGITLKFKPQDGSNGITLLHQIHVDNTP